MATDLAVGTGPSLLTCLVHHGRHFGDSPDVFLLVVHHEAGLQEIEAIVSTLIFDHLGYLCSPGSLV